MIEIIDFLSKYNSEVFTFVILIIYVLISNFYKFYKSKSQQKKEKLEQEVVKEDKERKEIENMKEIMDIFQNQFKQELIEKNIVNENLGILVVELKEKVEQLTINVKQLTELLNYRDDEMKKIAEKCKNITKEQSCIVLESLKKEKKKA